MLDKQITFSLSVISLAIALSACQGLYTPKYKNMIVIGDSLCVGLSPWPVYAGIAFNCVSGRRSTDLQAMPTGRDVIFYALLTNDVGKISAEEYRAQIRYHFSQVDNKIVCVLPDPVFSTQEKMDSLRELQSVMLEECSTVINMRDNGFLHRNPDGIHAGGTDQKDFGLSVKRKIESGEI